VPILALALALDLAHRWALGLILSADPQAPINGFEQASHRVTSGWHLDLDAITSPLLVGDGEGQAGFVVDVLRHVACFGMATVTEGAIALVCAVGVGTVRAVGGV